MSAEQASAADLDVVCIGNAIVDVLTQNDDATLARLGMTKGSMSLIDAETAERLYKELGSGIETSGGSAGNTAAGLASLGANCAYIGRVRDDQLGEIFAHDIRAVGAEYSTPPATAGPPTARCLILITPDAERTMSTFLGACADLGPDDIDGELIGRAKVTYLEGYLWDRDAAKQAFLKAARLAHAAGRMTALTLSDSFCVDRHRDSFRDLISNHIDILFANEAEILSLYEVDNFDAALQHAREDCAVAALTRSKRGSVIIAGDEVHVVDAEPVARVVDTTGAGDQFAAGFLFGYTRGDDLVLCGRVGGLAAAEVISHLGPRPQVSLSGLVEARLSAR